MEKKILTVKDRILKYADSKDISKRKIYQDTGMANGTLDKKSGLGEDNIVKFLHTYSEINPVWLLTGEGEMLKPNYQSNNNGTMSELEQLIKELRERLDDKQQTIEILKEQLAYINRKLDETGGLSTETSGTKKKEVS